MDATVICPSKATPLPPPPPLTKPLDETLQHTNVKLIWVEPSFSCYNLVDQFLYLSKESLVVYLTAPQITTTFQNETSQKLAVIWTTNSVQLKSLDLSNTQTYRGYIDLIRSEGFHETTQWIWWPVGFQGVYVLCDGVLKGNIER